MQYILLEDDISKLPLSVRCFNALKRNGVNTIGDMIRSKEEGKLQGFAFLGKKGVSEVEQCVESLYVGTTGFHIAADEDEIARRKTEDAVADMKRISAEENGDNPVSGLSLSARAINALMRAGIRTAGELYGTTEEQLLGMHNLGAKTAKEILDYIKDHLQSGFPMPVAHPDNGESTPDVVKGLVGELSSLLRLKPAICRVYIDETLEKFPEARSESFVYRLYESEPICAALHTCLLSLLEAREEGISYETLMEEIPSHLRNTTIVEEMLLSMEQEEEVRIEDDVYIRQYPSIVDYLNTLEDEKSRQIVLEKLTGKTLQEIGDLHKITRERVRQICNSVLKKASRSGQRYREDKYMPLFSQYSISREDFALAFDEPCSTYEYLSALTGNNSHFMKPLGAILEDENIPAQMRRQAERAIYKDYIDINGQHIHKDRPALVDYYVKTNCRELTEYDVFKQSYHEFLEELGLFGEETLRLNGRTYENKLSGHMCVLWNQWRRFRYYDILSRDYDNLLESLDLMRYDGMEISTLKLFRDNPALMEEFDIHDEYELHNLLKKIWDKSDDRVSFKKMPTIEVGRVDRDAQVWLLLLQYAPVSAERFGELYEDTYGVKALTILGGYMKNFDKYFFDGVYSIDTPDLPDNESNRLRDVLSEEYYTIQDVQRIYLREFPGADSSRINSYTLKTLGFRVYSGYVVRNSFASAVDYFNHLLTSQDVVDMREYPRSIQSISAYTTEMHRLRQVREIVEFGPFQFIHIRKLNQFGVTKELMEDYCRAVDRFVGHGGFFTVRSIVADGFTHPLDDLGFDECFYAAVLMEDRERFSYQKMGGERVFTIGTNKDIFVDMLKWLVDTTGKMDIYDLRDLLENQYGIVLDKDKLVEIIRGTEMHYDVIMEAVYIDYDAYFEEV